MAPDIRLQAIESQGTSTFMPKRRTFPKFGPACLQSVPAVVVRKPPPAGAKHDLERPRKRARTEARSTVVAPASDMQRFYHARSCTRMTEQETRAAFADPRGEPESDDEEDMAAWEVRSNHLLIFEYSMFADPWGEPASDAVEKLVSGR